MFSIHIVEIFTSEHGFTVKCDDVAADIRFPEKCLHAQSLATKRTNLYNRSEY